MKPTDKLVASATIKNTGDRPTVETAQLYIRDLVGTITRPVKELKHFKKVELNPGESKTVSFDISLDDLKFYNSDLKYAAEPGDFEVFIGPDSSVQNKAKFTLTEN
ncbi:MAG TPA: fibronectin type III-like domain-contianing protein [Drouetiella sp.]